MKSWHGMCSPFGVLAQLRSSGGGFSIASLFANGEDGAWFTPFDPTTLFQDDAGTTPVTTASQTVALMNDQSGNANHATQSTVAARPEYLATPDRIALDGVDDNMGINFGAAFTGTVLQGTPNGVIHYDFTDADGAWKLTVTPAYVPGGGGITGMVIRDGTLTSDEIAGIKAYLKDNGAGDDVAVVTSMQNWFRNRSDITSFYAGDFDTSSVTTFSASWYGCSSLVSFPLIDTSSVTNFAHGWYNCSSLTSFPLIDTSAGTTFSNGWYGCSSLTSFPLINTSSGTNFSNGWRNCSSLTSFPLIDTSAGTTFPLGWYNCSSLTSFPLIDTSAGTTFAYGWYGCSSLVSFPLIDTSSGTNFANGWYGCSSLTSFPLINTSSGTNFSNGWRNCSSLTSFPLINTSLGTNFAYGWYGCTSLTSFPANFFDGCSATNFDNAFTSTALSQASIDGILVSIESNVTSTGTFNQSGGSAPSATGEAAVTALRSRGWTVTVTGGF